MNDAHYEAIADVKGTYAEMQPAYHASLIAPADDMWASFADAASPYALLANGETVGFCAVNDERELMAFHLLPRFENQGARLLEFLRKQHALAAAVASTVDPGFLALCLEAGAGVETKALMYRHVLPPEGDAISGLRLASMSDHEAVVAFDEAAIGAPRSFLEPYLAERIENRELLLHEDQSRLIAIGECRNDHRSPGHAHLGIVVGTEHRGKGLGRRLLHALVLESRSRGLQPLCSTEPENHAAQAAIHAAGFRSQHRVFRIALPPRASDS